MKTDISAIFEEYNRAKRYKESLGKKGLYRQTEINTRFYSGDQWYGVEGGNERPLVRHNIIKRIGDFKMSQTANGEPQVTYFAQGVNREKEKRDIKSVLSGEGFFEGEVGENEINAVCRALGEHFRTTCERVDLNSLTARVLRDAYISGTGVLYTYFDGDADTGIKEDGRSVKGDIACEVLDIRDVYFGAAGEPDIEAQPYIIFAALTDIGAATRQAKSHGTLSAVQDLKPDEDGKILTLTKLFKVYDETGVSVHCVKVTEKGVLRRQYNTRLHRYPLSVFRFSEGNACAYGESEITYLIPNQIAINRMITAGVWSNIAMGMPIMVVNGDTVTGEVSNDPGQVIKIFGTNEDVAGAVKYVAPPEFSAQGAAQTLIETTLTQSGANPAALGDGQANNASAISRLQSAALMPLNVLKWRYREYLCRTAQIWADFWLNLYGSRKIRIEDENGTWYFPFNASRYRDVSIAAAVKIGEKEQFSGEQKAAALGELFEKGVITASQYVSRLPEGLIPKKQELLAAIGEEKDET